MGDAERNAALFHDVRHEVGGVATLWTPDVERPAEEDAWRGRLVWTGESAPDGARDLTNVADVGVSARSTQVMVSKGPAGYTLHVDGVAVQPVVPPGTTMPVATIRRFRGPFRSPDTGKTIVGPVSIALMTDTGQREPAVAYVKIVQQTAIDRQAVREDVVQTFELPSGNVQQPSIPVTNVPFPCRFIESPYIIIDDVYRLRLHQARKLYDVFVPVFAGIIRFVYDVVIGAAVSTVTGTLGVGAGTQPDDPGYYARAVAYLFGPAAPNPGQQQGAAQQGADAAPLSLIDRIKFVMSLWFPQVFVEDPFGAASTEDQQSGLLRTINLFLGSGGNARGQVQGVAALAWLLSLMRFTVLASFLDEGNMALLRTGMGIMDPPGGLGGAAEGPDEDRARDARSQLVGKVAKAGFKFLTAGGDPPRERRKYTLRGLTQTLDNLMAVDTDDALDTNRTIRNRYKNEAVLADFLMEPEAGILESIGEFFQKIFTRFGLSLFQSQDERGNLPRGLFFAAVGPADLSGLDVGLLRRSYVSTAIELHIVDPDVPAGGFRVRLVAEEEVGFQAGFHASGLVEDIDLLEDALLRFETVHCDPQAAPASSWYAIPQAFQRAFLPRPGDVSWTQTFARIRRVTRERMCAGCDKLRRTLLDGDTGPGARFYGELRELATGLVGAPVYKTLSLPELRRAHEQTPTPPLALSVTEALVLQVFPHRAVYKLPTAPTTLSSAQIGILSVTADYEQIHPKQPIDSAVEESTRAARGYVLSVSTLNKLHENSSRTRTLWFKAYVMPAANAYQALTTDAAIRRVGIDRPSFAVDSVGFPLAVRDDMQRWSTTTQPSIADDVDQIATFAPTSFSGTGADRERARVVTGERNYDDRAHASRADPSDLAEFLALRAVSNMLVARLVTRSRASAEWLCTRGALHGLRGRVSSFVAIAKLTTNDSRQGLSGVLGRNDLLFACLPGGADAARLMLSIGAWERDPAITLATGRGRAIARLDNTLSQRLANHNRWPTEAQAALDATGRATTAVARWPLAVASVYALQNALAVGDPEVGVQSPVVVAKVLEALESVQRTQLLGTSLDLLPAVYNCVLMRLLVHWPVLLATRHASADAASFATYVAQLSAPQAQQARGLPKRLGDVDAPPSSHDDAVECMRLRNATLRLDLRTLYDEHRAFTRPSAGAAAVAIANPSGPTVAEGLADELARLVLDTGYSSTSSVVPTLSATYFVPFAHGATPLSRVRSLFHPGSRGLDSAPVWADHLLTAVGRSTEHALLMQGGQAPAVSIVVANHDALEQRHSFELVATVRQGSQNELERVACRLVALTTPLVIGAASTQQPLNVETATELLLQDPTFLERGSLVDLLTWNAERIAQSALVGLGHGSVPPNGWLYCDPPDGPQMETTLTDDVFLPARAQLRRLQTLRSAVGSHALSLQRAFSAAVGSDLVAFVDQVNRPLAGVQGLGPAAPQPAPTPAEQGRLRRNLDNLAAVSAKADADSTLLDLNAQKVVATGAPVGSSRDVPNIIDMITNDSEDAIERRWARMAPDTSLRDNWQPDATVLDYVAKSQEYERVVKGEALRVRALDPRLAQAQAAVLNAPGGLGAWDDVAQVDLVFQGGGPDVDRHGLYRTTAKLLAASAEYAQTVDKRRFDDEEMQERETALQDRTELATRQGAMAFVCSVALADALLASVLGDGVAPRLVARSDDPTKKGHLDDAKALVAGRNTIPVAQPTAVSLHEAALVLEQLVRSVV